MSEPTSSTLRIRQNFRIGFLLGPMGDTAASGAADLPTMIILWPTADNHPLAQIVTSQETTCGTPTATLATPWFTFRVVVARSIFSSGISIGGKSTRATARPPWGSHKPTPAPFYRPDPPLHPSPPR